MRTFRASLLVPALTILGLLLAAASAGAVVAPAGQPAQPFLGHYDVRVMGGAEVPRLAVTAAATDLRNAEAAAHALDGAMRQAAARLEATVPGVKVERSPIGGGVEVVGGAPLSAPAPGKDGRSIVLGFLRANAEVYGLSAEQVEHLEFLGESDGPGARTVNLRQTIRGLPVFQSDTRAILDAEGRLLRTVGRLVPGIDEARVSEEFALGSDEALGAALQTVGLRLEAAEVTRRARSERLYFPLGPGMVVPAWAHVTLTRGDSDWYTVVDARTGVLLWRKDIRYHWRRKPRKAANEDCVEVYAKGPDNLAENSVPLASPAPGPTEPSCAVDRKALHGPVRWFAENGPRTTTGPFVDAYLDHDADDNADEGSRPIIPNFAGTSCSAEFSYIPPQCTPEDGHAPDEEDFPKGALTNLFYLVNWFHDTMDDLGFTEGMKSFQGDDRIRAEAQYGAGVNIYNLASFTSPPDGTSGILRLSLWNGPDVDRDASLDAEVVFHELMHGVTSRIIGNGAGLNWYPGRALAEGWSDFFALALLDPAGKAGTDASDDAVGRYTAYKLGGHTDFTENYKYGMRRFPYSASPLKWSDADDTTDCFGTNLPCTGQSELRWESFGANEIHNAGELWALALWEARTAALDGLTDAERKDSAKKFLEVVFNGLIGLPADPSFIQARNALLTADCEGDTNCPFKTAIWAAFAARGLGTQACDSRGIATHYGIHGDGSTDSTQVADCIPPTSTSSQTTITVTCSSVTNPSQECSAGEPIDPNNPNSGRFTCSFESVDRPDCMNEDGEIPGCIPDAYAPGKQFILEICNLSTKVHKVDLRINKLNHPWVGDLTIMLKGPNGYGTDFVYRIPDDLTITIDGKDLSLGRFPGMNQRTCLGNGPDNDAFQITETAVNDFFKGLLPTQGCFTGAWKPSFNSSNWFTYDSTNQLVNFRGSDIAGKWKLFVTDSVPDGNTNGARALNSWSLVITPAVVP